jgi:hypothetical protein
MTILPMAGGVVYLNCRAVVLTLSSATVTFKRKGLDDAKPQAANTNMRIVLLSLALFYAWLPPGLCACGLQAALFPRSADEPGDDDHEDSHECHCAGVKPLCALLAREDVNHNNQSLPVCLPPANHDQVCCAEALDSPACPCGHAAALALYLTLRALLI